MLNKKISVFLMILVSIIVSSGGVFAQGLDIGGSISFSYVTYDGTDKGQTLEEAGEKYTHNYNFALNLKNNLTSKGSFRSAVRYSINDGFETKDEATSLNFDLSYDKVSCSIGLQDNTNSDLKVGVSNGKSTNLNFQINPEILPRFTFSYSSSISGSELTTSSNNTFNIQFAKNFRIQNSNLSTAILYGDNSDNITGKQSSTNMFNLNYGINLLDDKLTLNTGYRVGNTYDINNSINNLNESGDFTFGFNVFNNLNINGDWAKSSTFSSESAKKDVTNNNSFRMNYTPMENLGFTLGVNFMENQTSEAINKSTTKNFSTRFPPILGAVNVTYTYNNSETDDTLSAGNSIAFDLNLGRLNISNFSSNARYGTSKTKDIDTETYTENVNFGFGFSTTPVENLTFVYGYTFDNAADISGTNRDAYGNTITVNYSLMLMEGLNTSLGTSYSNNQSLTGSTSSSVTSYTYNGSLDYKMGETELNFNGSLSQSFDESGVHISQKSGMGPGLNTKFMGVNLSARALVSQDVTDGELTSSNNVSYILGGSYPVGTKGSSSFTYTSTSTENVNDPSASADSENFTFNISFTF